MASEQSKSSSSPQEGVQPPSVTHYPPQYNGQYLPPPGAFPPYYTYASIQDGSHDPNAPNGAPPIPQYVMAAFPPPPPGMVYAYPAPHPGQAYPAFAAGLPPPAPTARPKRKQVKMACTNCASACKRCDEARPCERCIKYGISDTCVDGVRKERKKGIKRGPYKRKNRASGGFSPPGDAEQQPPPAPYPIQTEGYYPYFYPPPPPGYGPPPPAPDGQAHPEGAPNGTAPPIPHPPYYPVHPAVYAPYGPYPGAAPIGYPPPPVPTSAPAPNAPPSSTAKTDQSSAVNVATGDGAATKSKKRTRAKSGDEGSTRAKKAKEANGDVALGKDQRQLGVPPEHGPAFTGSEPRALVAAV